MYIVSYFHINKFYTLDCQILFKINERLNKLLNRKTIKSTFDYIFG